MRLNRTIALCALFFAALGAQAGVKVEFITTPEQGTYPPGAIVMFDVFLRQDPLFAVDLRLRMIEFDLQDTSPYLTVTLPVTHDRGTPQPEDDIRFWRFDSLPNCRNEPSFCGFGHYVDDDLGAGKTDPRTNVLAVVFYGNAEDGSAQLVVPGNGSAMLVGRLQVTTPLLDGVYTLNLLNADDPDSSNRRARVDHGFDPHVTWRAGLSAPNDVSGGTYVFGGDPPLPPNLVSASPANNQSLPWTRLHVIRLAFDGPLVAPGPGEIRIEQLLPGGLLGANLNTPGNFTFHVEPANVLRIGDTATHLTNQRWYAIRNVGDWKSGPYFRLNYVVQMGDANNDGRLLFQDLSFINTQIGTTDARDDNRRDINRDFMVVFTDLGAANVYVPSDLVPKPCGHVGALPCP